MMMFLAPTPPATPHHLSSQGPSSMIEMAKSQAKALAKAPPSLIRIPEVPIVTWLRHYQIADLTGDLVGGMASVVLLIPQVGR